LLLAEEEKEKRAKSIEELYAELKPGLENADYKTQKEIIGWLVEKIVKKRDKLEIEFRLPFNVSDLGSLLLSPNLCFSSASPRMD